MRVRVDLGPGQGPDPPTVTRKKIELHLAGPYIETCMLGLIDLGPGQGPDPPTVTRKKSKKNRVTPGRPLYRDLHVRV